MALKPTLEGMEKAVSEVMEPGEELKTVGWAWEKGLRYCYVALTNKRLITLKLSMLYRVKDSEGVPLADLEGCSIYEGCRYAPPDSRLLSRMAETPLYVKTRKGIKRCFRFSEVLGLDNRSVPVQIMEAVKPG
jgi:hypothetical protein